MMDCIKCEINVKPKYKIGQDVWVLYLHRETVSCPCCDERIVVGPSCWLVHEMTIAGIFVSFDHNDKPQIHYIFPTNMIVHGKKINRPYVSADLRINVNSTGRKSKRQAMGIK